MSPFFYALGHCPLDQKKTEQERKHRFCMESVKPPQLKKAISTNLFKKSILHYEFNHSISHLNHIQKCHLLFSPLMLKLDGSGRPFCRVRHASAKYNKILTPRDLFSPQNVHLLFWEVSIWLSACQCKISLTKMMVTADV